MTALAPAVILVGTQLAENIGMTDAGTNKAPWLNLSVLGERGGDNPLLELRRQYDRWRRTQPK